MVLGPFKTSAPDTPLTAILSQVVPLFGRSKRRAFPFSVSDVAELLAKVSVPMVPKPPGARMPPAFTVTVPLMVPLPPSMPPFTVTALLAFNEPGLFTSKVPALTVVGPV